ncbi:MAG: efflux RND transporter periplasmic adaptor subunit [bacterium]|nr:efflux RND transporter periplasmic adaptor subunit [bacterium]
MMRRALLITLATLLCLAIGMVGMRLLMGMRRPPQRVVIAKQGKAVRVIAVSPQTVTMTINGFGAVRAKTEWRAVPEVSGKVITLSPQVQAGLHVKEGELLFVIDPRAYRLTAQRIRSEIQQVHTEIDLLQQQRRNHEATLRLAERDLSIAEAELQRDEALVLRGTIASRERDSRRQWRNRFANTVQEVSNLLALITPQIDKAKAAIAVAQSRLAEAELQIEKTRILAPFNGQVVRTSLSRGEYVEAGREVMMLYDTTVVEIPLTIPLDDLRWLPELSPNTLRNAAQTPERAAISLPPATVRWRNAENLYTWQGHVQRWEAGLDQQSRTLTLVVEVRDPWSTFQPGARPPLQPGMFCEVDIQTMSRTEAIVIPRAALHDDNTVYLAQDNLLASRKVRVLRLLRDQAVIASGLQPGDRVIVSPLDAPVLGMKLRPQATSQPPPTTLGAKQVKPSSRLRLPQKKRSPLASLAKGGNGAK